MTVSFTVYVAGALFTHKDLIGNAFLARAIEDVSKRRYVCVLPQDLEQATSRTVDIRNQDLQQVMACDLGLFNFDGTELDSGTVVEFMMAKFLDIPAVVLRTDFRTAGDQAKDGAPWNLMCSFYPRTAVVQANAMQWYHAARQTGGSLDATCSRVYSRLATVVVDNLDAVRQEPPLATAGPGDLSRFYHWALQVPGGGFADRCGGPAFVETVLAAKRRKGLL